MSYYPPDASVSSSLAVEDNPTQRLRPGTGKHSEDRPGKTNPALVLPTVGDRLFGFSLRRELGRGAFAHVFLAEQVDLAGRHVVLKVSGLDSDEPQTLAQLQQTHIVPIYSVHEDERAGLRAVCMPYFGGASLARVLQQLGLDTRCPKYGHELVDALSAVACPVPVGGSEAAPAEPGLPFTDEQALSGLSESEPLPLQELAALPYAQAAAVLIAKLADAVHHAHQHGICHCDIKPSNILLSADGEPMLLDFNVARRLRGGPIQASVGGTVAYMSPEHLRALADTDAKEARNIDHRADIYSLGMVLYEMLVGSSPFEHSASYAPVRSLIQLIADERSRTVPSLRTKRPDLPWALESILRKCMDPDPARRYQRADHLAEDLRCFLEDLPLRHAPELSQTERVRKWARRHPRLTSSTTALTAAAILLVGIGGVLLTRLATTRGQLQILQTEDHRRAFEEGTQRALCLVNTVTEAQDHLLQGKEVCEATLGIYGILDRPDWQDAAEWQRLDPEVRRQLGEEARELLLLLAWSRTRLAQDNPAVLRQALGLLDLGEEIRDLSPSRAFEENRALFLQKLGETAAAEAARAHARQMPPVSARDHYLLALVEAQQGHYEDAIRSLDQALRLNPRHYWSTVQRGICHQELHHYVQAAADYGACIGLWPEFAWGYFNRGYVLDQSGNKADAIRDYTAALERDPSFVLAYVNRGLARLELKEYAPALQDFDQAAQRGRDDAALHAGRGVAFEGLQRYGEADAAFAAAFARAEKLEPAMRQRIYWVYGFAVHHRLPDKARAAFDEVLKQQPNHPQALYGRAISEVEEGRNAEALRSFSRILEIQPSFLEARRFRAILFARQGDFDSAGRDINDCLQKDPSGGATSYAAACIAAHAVARSSSPATKKQISAQGFRFLEQSFAAGYGREKAAQDPDLEGLRRLPDFQALLKTHACATTLGEEGKPPTSVQASEATFEK
jgi:serine/threonine protein kinase/tetratricopeptide (TPR) repeat protein